MTLRNGTISHCANAGRSTAGARADGALHATEGLPAGLRVRGHANHLAAALIPLAFIAAAVFVIAPGKRQARRVLEKTSELPGDVTQLLDATFALTG